MAVMATKLKMEHLSNFNKNKISHFKTKYTNFKVVKKLKYFSINELLTNI